MAGTTSRTNNFFVLFSSGRKTGGWARAWGWGWGVLEGGRGAPSGLEPSWFKPCCLAEGGGVGGGARKGRRGRSLTQVCRTFLV